MKKFDLTERRIEHIDKKNFKITIFDLDAILKTYLNSTKSIKIKITKIKEKDEYTDDLLRSYIVFLESAFDYFIHCLIKYSFDAMLNCRIEKTEGYYKFEVPMEIVEAIYLDAKDDDEYSELLKYINDKYSSITFMSVNSINLAFKLIYGNKMKDLKKLLENEINVAKDNSNNINKIDEYFSNLYERRNQISHQDDRSHETGSKNSISVKEVSYYVNINEKIVSKIIEFSKKLEKEFNKK